jgi:perosamine synthetase
MKISFQVSKPVLCGNEKAYVNDALDSGWISSNGAYIERFEKAIAGFLGVDRCLSSNNGTTALHLACLAMGLKPGDEVIVPTLTYVASANAVAYCGAKPIFSDCAPDTWNSTVENIEAAWTEKTVGVMVVHLYGLPAPVPEIKALCEARGAWLIEDCAESLGATIDGRPTGTFGDAATFSFYGNKTISTGEGGAVYVRDAEKQKLARMLRGQGMDLQRRYWHPIIGYNYRMTNIAAAIGLGQIEMVDYHLSERRRIAATYTRCLDPLAKEGLLRLPASKPGYKSTFWLFSSVLTSGGSERRERVMARLAEDYGIETRPFFVPMHHLPMYPSPGSFPEADYLSAHGVNFPTYSGLEDSQIEEICTAIGQVVRSTLNQRV